MSTATTIRNLQLRRQRLMEQLEAPRGTNVCHPIHILWMVEGIDEKLSRLGAE